MKHEYKIDLDQLGGQNRCFENLGAGVFSVPASASPCARISYLECLHVCFFCAVDYLFSCTTLICIRYYIIHDVIKLSDNQMVP